MGALSGRLTSAFGSLDEGFHLSIAGKEKGKPIALGSEISVSVSWDVLLPDIFFYLDECSLEHGPVRVSMVKGSCFSKALSVKKMAREVHSLAGFSMRTLCWRDSEESISFGFII